MSVESLELKVKNMVIQRVVVKAYYFKKHVIPGNYPRACPG